MGAITLYSNIFVLGIRICMVFIPCILGQLESRQGFVHYEQSSNVYTLSGRFVLSGNTICTHFGTASREGFVHYEQSNDTAEDFLSQRHQTVGCNITYIICYDVTGKDPPVNIVPSFTVDYPHSGLLY